MRSLKSVAAALALVLPALAGCGTGSPTTAPKTDGAYQQKMQDMQKAQGGYEQMMKQKMGGAQPTGK